MSDLERAVTAETAAFRPDRTPPFEQVLARRRASDRRSRTAAGTGLLALAAVGAFVVPATLREGQERLSPPAAAPTAPDASAAPSTAPPDGACGVQDKKNAPGMPDADDYVGLTLEAARERAAQSGSVLVVLGSDGDCPFAIPDDLRGDRVNVYLENGRVADAAIG